MSGPKVPRGTRGNGGISDGQKHCYLKTVGIWQIVPTKFGKFKGTVRGKKYGKLSFKFGKLGFGKLSFGKLSLTSQTQGAEQFRCAEKVHRAQTCH